MLLTILVIWGWGGLIIALTLSILFSTQMGDKNFNESWENACKDNPELHASLSIGTAKFLSISIVSFTWPYLLLSGFCKWIMKAIRYE